jgi:signal transduction histidine kinase
VKNEQISDDLRVVIFRILQESLNNIAKHSQADHISVFLGERDLNFELVVEDNGRGYDGPPVCEHEICEKGTGLDSMRERAELSGGSLTIDSEVGRGTCIRLTWPQNKITGTYP